MGGESEVQHTEGEESVQPGFVMIENPCAEVMSLSSTGSLQQTSSPLPPPPVPPRSAASPPGGGVGGGDGTTATAAGDSDGNTVCVHVCCRLLCTHSYYVQYTYSTTVRMNEGSTYLTLGAHAQRGLR